MPIKKETLEAFPFLADKLVVDVVNGVEVAGEHIRVQRNRSAFASRIYDSITGKSIQRQVEINASQNEAIDATFAQLTKLCESATKSNRAILQVNRRVDHLAGYLTKLATHSVELKENMEKLDAIRKSQISQLDADIREIRLEMKARRHMDFVLSKWDAGLFDSLSVSARYYTILEDLRWGDFGDFFRHGEQVAIDSLVATLKNTLIVKLRKDVGCSVGERVNTCIWLEHEGQKTELMEALQYSGDWSNETLSPYSYSITQAQFIERLPQQLPLLLSAERLVEKVSKEVIYE